MSMFIKSNKLQAISCKQKNTPFVKGKNNEEPPQKLALGEVDLTKSKTEGADCVAIGDRGILTIPTFNNSNNFHKQLYCCSTTKCPTAQCYTFNPSNSSNNSNDSNNSNYSNNSHMQLRCCPTTKCPTAQRPTFIKSVAIHPFKKHVIASTKCVAIYFLIVIAFFFILPSSASSHPAFDIKDGLKALESGDLDKAESLLQKARLEESDSYVVNYDLGIVSYRKRDYAKSIRFFERASELSKSPEQQFDALYNMGNAAFKSYDFAEAVQAYKNALLIKKDDYKADYNLKVAEKKLQEMLERQKKEQEQQNQDQKDKQQDKQQQENKDSQNQQGNQDKKEQQQNQQQGQQEQQNQQGQQEQQNQNQQGDSQQNSQSSESENKSGEEQQQNAEQKEGEQGKEKQDSASNENKEDSSEENKEQQASGSENESDEQKDSKNSGNQEQQASNQENKESDEKKKEDYQALTNEEKAAPESDRRDVKMAEDKGKVSRPEASQRARAMKNIRLKKEEVEAYLKEMEQREGDYQKYYRFDTIEERDPSTMNQEELKEWLRIRNRKKEQRQNGEQDW